MKTISIIGIGNSFRGDDACGLHAISLLQNKNLKGVELFSVEGEASKILSLWEGSDTVFIIDAISSESEPGKVYRRDLRAKPLEETLSPPSSHSISLRETIEVARQLNKLPSQVILYGIEGKNFSMGEAMSEKVLLATEKVVEEIIQEINKLR